MSIHSVESLNNKLELVEFVRRTYGMNEELANLVGASVRAEGLAHEPIRPALWEFFAPRPGRLSIGLS